MKLYVESSRFQSLSKLISEKSYDDGICIDLNVLEFLSCNNMIHTEPVTMDDYVLDSDLQYAADTFCAELEIINY